MNAVPFDTLRLAQDFAAAGLAPAAASGIAKAIADALVGADLATKADLAGVEARLDAKIDTKIELLRRDMIIRFGSMLVVAVGVLLTAMRLMPHP